MLGHMAKNDVYRIPARMNRAQLDFVRSMSDGSAPEQSARRRALVAEMREAWFADLARIYPQAVKAIEDALDPAKASTSLRASTAKWLVEQRRSMVTEEREAVEASREADTLDAKAPHEMTQAELIKSIARLEILAAAEQAEDAEIVSTPTIFD
jgi:hypothetical protein